MRLLAVIKKEGGSSLKNFRIKKMDRLKEYEGKNVYVKLKDGRKYSGKVLNVENKGTYLVITLKDKYGFHVSFPDSSISFIEEQGAKIR